MIFVVTHYSTSVDFSIENTLILSCFTSKTGIESARHVEEGNPFWVSSISFCLRGSWPSRRMTMLRDNSKEWRNPMP